MTIEETKKCKIILQETIAKLLNDFEKIHGVEILKIEYDWPIKYTGYYNDPRSIRILINI